MECNAPTMPCNAEDENGQGPVLRHNEQRRSPVGSLHIQKPCKQKGQGPVLHMDIEIHIEIHIEIYIHVRRSWQKRTGSKRTGSCAARQGAETVATW